MPSRVFAAPLRQVDELTALSTHRDKENLASPVLAKGEYNFELALDFQSRKHVDPEASVEVYTFGLQEDVSSSHPSFPMPGLASANMLRNYLHKYLQPHQIIDERGDECDLSGISNDHLAVLQAKMWTKVSKSRSPTKTTSQRPSKVQVLVADHVAKISQLLEEKHLFVLSNTAHDICAYLKDLQVTPKHTCQSQIVRLEPLIHWGTVTPSIESQSILAFRRDGELMQQPEYWQLVRRLVDMQAPTYCVDCLEYLWRKRAEARDTMRQLQGALPRPQLRNSDPVQITRPFKNPRSTLVGASALTVSGTLGPAYYQSKPADGELHGDFGSALPQLDGASDRPEEAQIRHFSSNGHGKDAIWISSDSDEVTKKHCGLKKPLPRMGSFTMPLRSASVTPESSDGHSALSAPAHLSRAPPSTATKIYVATKKKPQKKGALTRNKCGSRVIDLTTPPPVKERKFGRELDTNTAVPLVQVTRSPRKYKVEVSMSQENLRPTPVRPIKPLKAFKKTRDLTKQTKKRKIAPIDTRYVEQKKARIMAPKEPKLLQPKAQINSTTGPRPSPEPEPTIRPPSPPQLTVHFAKRPTKMDVPDSVATLTYESFQNMRPASTSKICWCDKPASHGFFKKGEQAQIAQCTNLDCRFRWYHYACLSQSDKGKARWGTLECQHCLNEQEFAEQDTRNGWGMARQMDFKLEWTREDIEAEMSGPEGCVPGAHPYGLGVEIDLGPAHKADAPTEGTLSGLARTGYAQSRPYMLREAYTNAEAYAGLGAELAEDEPDGSEWWYETRAADDDYGGDEEMVGIGTGEEL